MSSSPILRLSEVKSRNMLSILRFLVQRDHMSRAELALALGCDSTTVSRATRELLDRGLLHYCGKTAVVHGRPREILCLDSARHCNLGLAFDRESITAVLTTLRGETKGAVTRQLPSGCSREDFVGALLATAKPLLAQVKGTLTGIGIAANGTVTADGVLLDVSHFPELEGLPLKQICEQAFGSQPLVVDPLPCQLQRHLMFREADRQKNTLYILAGTEIGMGVAMDGTVVGKHQHHAGEFGHNNYEPDGLLCTCGRRGCLETRCSTGALTARLHRCFNYDVDFNAVCQLARSRHELVMLEVASVANLLGTAIANQVNNLYPDHLIIAGQLPALGQEFQDILIRNIRGQLFPAAAEGLSIDCLETDQTTSATGAALLVTARLLDDITFLDQVCPPQPS